MGLQKFKHKNFYYSYSDDNTKVAFQYTCSMDQKSKICIWDIVKKEKVYQIERTGQTAPIHFTSDGRGLVSFRKQVDPNDQQKISDNMIVCYTGLVKKPFARIDERSITKVKRWMEFNSRRIDLFKLPAVDTPDQI